MVKIYYADVSDVCEFEFLIKNLSEPRKSYVESITDSNRRKQSLCVWLLLEYALNDMGITSFKYHLKDNGEWVVDVDGVFVSLSHSKNIVAVSIGDQVNGVDVEACSEKLFKIEKLFNDNNKKQEISVEDLALCWTEKESKIKAKINGFMSNIMLSDGLKNKYCLSVCCKYESPSFVGVGFDEVLKKIR